MLERVARRRRPMCVRIHHVTVVVVVVCMFLAIRYLTMKYMARRDDSKSPPEYLKSPSRELRHDVYFVVDKGARSQP